MNSSSTLAPLWLNGWKHHSGVLCREILCLKNAEQEDFRQFCLKLKMMGSSVSDLYFGVLNPEEIAVEISGKLKALRVFEKVSFFRWIDLSEKLFRELTISDGSTWTLLKGKEEDFYLHIHPSRYSPHTLRIKASILKTAGALIAFEHVFPEKECSKGTLNFLRKTHLGLSPVKEAQMDGIMGIARLLRQSCRKA